MVVMRMVLVMLMTMIVVVMVFMAGHTDLVAVGRDETFDAKQPDDAERHPPAKKAARMLHGFGHDVEERGSEHDTGGDTEVELQG